MNLADLIAQYRTDADDKQAGPLSVDEDLTVWFNEAEDEACIRARLIHESADPALCKINVRAGVASYRLDPAVLEITHITFTPTGTTREITLGITDRVELDRVRAGWRRLTEEPRDVIQDDSTLQLGCLPSTDGVIQLECYRLPPCKMVNDEDSPRIGAVHHRNLVHWALFRAYSRPDAEINNPEGAGRALAAFTAYFGERPDVDLMRSTRANRPQFNKAIW